MGSHVHKQELGQVAARAQRPLRTWGRWASTVLCAGAIWSNAGCGDDTPDPEVGQQPGPAQTGDGGSQGPSNSDGGVSAPADTGVPAKDAGTPGGGSNSDAGPGATPEGGVVPGTDAAAPTGDASTGDTGAGPGPGPITLPTPDLKGPYEVVKVLNTGVGFENPPTAANDRGDGAGCTSFIQSFGETAQVARDYALFGPDYKVALYTLYYPKGMVEGQLYPILSWANGTCAKTTGYDALLSHLTSHGFIVIATNSRYTAGGKFQLRGVDYVVAENAKADSPLYQHVAVDKVGVFGHSQGGGSTWSASADKRVKTSVVLNAGGSGARSTPSFFVTGDKDIAPDSSMSSAKAQTQGAGIRLHKIEGTGLIGHITLMKQPERVYPSVAAWFRYYLLGDEVGKTWFIGADCKLCNKPTEWTFYAAPGLK